MRLYHIGNSRSTRVLWTLEEIGEPYEVEKLTWETRDGEEHHRRHPLGKVPVFELDDGRLLFESAAICLQLADMHPEAGLIPPVGSYDRALVYQWTLFAMTELEKLAFRWLGAHRRGEDESTHVRAFAPLAAMLRGSLDDHEWIAGETFSVADILLASMLRNVVACNLLATDDPLRLYVDRALARRANLRADAVDADPSEMTDTGTPRAADCPRYAVMRREIPAIRHIYDKLLPVWGRQW